MQLSIWPGILRHRLYTSVSYAVTGFYSLVPWTADPTSVTPNSDLFFLCSERLFFYLNSTSFHCALGNVPGKSQMQDHLLCFPLPKQPNFELFLRHALCESCCLFYFVQFWFCLWRENNFYISYFYHGCNWEPLEIFF